MAGSWLARCIDSAFPSGSRGAPGTRSDSTRASARSRWRRECGRWARTALAQFGLAVDALLGTGASGAPRPPMAALLQRLADLEVPIVAIDGPTGVDLESGIVHGVARADLSITFGGARRGHLLARDETGTLVITDIGHPPADPTWPMLVSDVAGRRVASPAPEPRPQGSARPRRRHRWGRGDDRRGAPRLSFGLCGRRRARPRSGAARYRGGIGPGRARPSNVRALPSTSRPPSDLLALVARADAVVIGPGLGRAPGRSALIAALAVAARAVVLDADALIAFQGACAELRAFAGGAAARADASPGRVSDAVPGAGHGARARSVGGRKHRPPKNRVRPSCSRASRRRSWPAPAAGSSPSRPATPVLPPAAAVTCSAVSWYRAGAGTRARDRRRASRRRPSVAPPISPRDG